MKKCFFSLAAILFASTLLGKLPDVYQMSLKEKVGQILMVHLQGEEVNDDAKILINELLVGNIIYYNWANGLKSPLGVQKLSNGLQELAQKNVHPIPLFIAVDQEGGPVTRLSAGFTQFPSALALGTLANESFAESAAFAMGEEMKAVGVNMNLAPVIDVITCPCSYIGVRSFGSDPLLVRRLATAQLKGYQRAGVVTSLKHFPGGLGSISTDPHKDLLFLDKSKEELMQNELLPYLHLAPLADTIMVGHVLIPSLDPNHPASLSPLILQSLLRKEIGYNGVILSDSLVMEGVLKNYPSIEETALAAFNAGSDLLILGGKQLLGHHQNMELTISAIRQIESTLISAVQEGRISEERLNGSVERILALKNKAGLFTEKAPTLKSIKQKVSTAKHQALAFKISKLVTKVIRKDLSLAHFRHKKVILFAPSLLKENLKETSFRQMETVFSTLNPEENEAESARAKATQADLIIALSYQSWRNPTEEQFIQGLLHLGKPSIVLVLRDPVDAELFSDANVVITTLSPTAPSIEAAFQLL